MMFSMYVLSTICTWSYLAHARIFAHFRNHSYQLECTHTLICTRFSHSRAFISLLGRYGVFGCAVRCCTLASLCSGTAFTLRAHTTVGQMAHVVLVRSATTPVPAPSSVSTDVMTYTSVSNKWFPCAVTPTVAPEAHKSSAGVRNARHCLCSLEPAPIIQVVLLSACVALMEPCGKGIASLLAPAAMQVSL